MDELFLDWEGESPSMKTFGTSKGVSSILCLFGSNKSFS